MEMINRLMCVALDPSKFVDRIKQAEKTMRDDALGMSSVYENRQQRRARERAEAKAARKAAINQQLGEK